MAGILDWLGSDEAALGLGLLASSGPTTDPNQTGLGRVLAGGVQFANANRRANAELAIKEAEARRKALIENLGIQLLTGGSGIPTAAAPAGGETQTTAATPGAGAAPLIGPGAGPAPAGGSAIGGLTGTQRQALGADLIFGGGKNAGSMLAGFSEPKFVNVGGNLVNTNAPGFQGGVQKQIVTGRDGQVYMVEPGPNGEVVTKVDPSSIAAFKQFQDISNLSRAQTTPGKETILPGGRMGGQSQAAEIGLPAMGGAAPAPLIGPGAGPQAPVVQGGAPIPANEGTPQQVVASAQSELREVQRALASPALAGPANASSRAMLEQHALGLQQTIANGGRNVQTATPAALIGPGAGPQPVAPAPAMPAAPAAPLPVQTSVIPGGGTAFSPTEQTAFATQTKAAESAAGQTGAILKEAQDSANSAVQTVGAANRIHAVLDSGVAYTGKGADVKLTASQWADALGITGKDAADRVAQTRAAIQDLAKLTLEGRQMMKGQGSVTIDEGRLAQQAVSGNIDLSPAELKQLANAADRSARFKYKVAIEQIGAAGASNPALAAQLPMFQPQPLPDPFKAPEKTAAPASTTIPSGWTVRQK